MLREPACLPSLSIIVPAFNEARNLPGCLTTLHATLADSSYEVIVVDDGSSDQTLAVARELAAVRPDRMQVLAHDRNRGFGAAFRTGIDAAAGRYVLACPADFAMTAADWAPLASAIGSANVVVGRRERREGYNLLMRFNSWLYPKLVRALFGLRLRDVGWICIYPRDLLREVTITQNGVPMLVEVLIKLRDLGATFREVDCRMQPRRIGTPSCSRFRVMWRTLVGLFVLRWSYRSTRVRPIADRVAQEGLP